MLGGEGGSEVYINALMFVSLTASRAGVLGRTVALFCGPFEAAPCDPLRRSVFQALAPGAGGWVPPVAVPAVVPAQISRLSVLGQCPCVERGVREGG